MGLSLYMPTDDAPIDQTERRHDVTFLSVDVASRENSSLVPVVSHLRISLMGLAPSKRRDRAPESVARSRSEARGFTRLVKFYSYMVRSKENNVYIVILPVEF
jgi:hypothetical protein